MTHATQPRLAGTLSQQILSEVSDWGQVTTIVLHLGSVFEFKGEFPRGHQSEGFYNLDNGGTGFEGHLGLESIDHIAFQERKHRGRDSYALVFNDARGSAVFKIFLGRNSAGATHAHQLDAYRKLKATADNLPE